MAESPRQPGWREVILVAAGVVAVVAGAVVLTALMPPSIQDVVFRGPLLIGVLIVGTAFVLWRISRRRPTDSGR